MRGIMARAKSVFCQGEAERFPAEEFVETPNGLVHLTSTPHYAATGESMESDSVRMPGSVIQGDRGISSSQYIASVGELDKKRAQKGP
jgi:hypothetical protein